MDRTVAAGATSGSLAALLLRLVSESLHTEIPLPLDCPLCPDFSTTLHFENLDLPSLGLGILLGLLIGPLLDCVQLVRQGWSAWLRATLRRWAREEREQLYKLA